MTLFICGNSHTRALRAGASYLEEEEGADPMVVFPLGPADHEEEPFSRIEDGRVVLTHGRFRKKLKQFFGFNSFSPDHRWGICLANQYSRIYGDETWHTFAPAWLNLDDRPPVSEALFARMVDADMVHCYAFFEQLLETGVRPFFIEAPFPLRTHPAITKVGIAPALVKSIDIRARQIVGQWMSDRGVSIVTPPAETADAEGFLLPEYAKGGNDHYHGNKFYGRLMMRRVLQHTSQEEHVPRETSDQT